MDENLQPKSVEEIDAEIKKLQDLKLSMQPKAVATYETQPIREKIVHDFHPVRVATDTLKILLILGLIAGGIWAWGYYKGKKKATDSRPVQIELKYGKEAMIDLGNGEWLHIDKDGNVHIQDSNDDKTAKVHRVIQAKDVPGLWEELKPYGFDVRPFITAGGSIGQAGPKQEVGVGMQWYRFYKVYLNSFITTAGAYPVGISYRLTDNFDIMTGVGWGYSGDQRLYLGGKMRF